MTMYLHIGLPHQILPCLSLLTCQNHRCSFYTFANTFNLSLSSQIASGCYSPPLPTLWSARWRLGLPLPGWADDGGGGVVACFLKASSCETSALRLCCTWDVRLAVMCLCPWRPSALLTFVFLVGFLWCVLVVVWCLSFFQFFFCFPLVGRVLFFICFSVF
jgi:hypothetical protein